MTGAMLSLRFNGTSIRGCDLYDPIGLRAEERVNVFGSSLGAWQSHRGRLLKIKLTVIPLLAPFSSRHQTASAAMSIGGRQKT